MRPLSRILARSCTVVPVKNRHPGIIHHEVMCTFATVEVWDIVRIAASKLADHPPGMAGLRLEIPGYLQPHFRVLQNIGFKICSRHPGARRNIVFDDGRQDLALDVKISDAEDWATILPEDAKGNGGTS